MSRFVCYYQPEKNKSRLVLEAFAEGCDATLATVHEPKLLPGVPVFYGVRPEWAHLWEQAKREQRDWVFIDNSYFDVTRERYFRVTKNAIQHTGRGKSDGKRFGALDIPVMPMRDDGDYVLVCQQSDEFMRTVGEGTRWIQSALKATFGDAPALWRKKDERRPLREDLRKARAVLTWSSAAAVTAVLEGVPVRCSVQCCASHVGKDRRQWASVLADNQFTLEEMASGLVQRA